MSILDFAKYASLSVRRAFAATGPIAPVTNPHLLAWDGAPELLKAVEVFFFFLRYFSLFSWLV
jgi:hypothetical protein